MFFKGVSHIHMVGIGGVGLSALAELLHHEGYHMSGSDQKESPFMSQLERLGIKTYVGHSEQNMSSHLNMVVFSSAIDPSNVEIKWAKKKGIHCLKRKELLDFILKNRKNVAISGSHGKTTTTSMLSSILLGAKEDPTILLGAYWKGIESNFKYGAGDWTIVEADESDGSLLYTHPRINGITNIDIEHIDYYKDEEKLKKVFLDFMNLPKVEVNFVCGDNGRIKSLIKKYFGSLLTYGIGPENDIFILKSSLDKEGIRFEVNYKGEELGEFFIPILGEYNILNALLAISIANYMGIDKEVIREALSSYILPNRRLEVRGKYKKATIIEDYAHHPTEIKAAYGALEQIYSQIYLVYQPHKHTRTRDHLQGLIHIFKEIEHAYLVPIYGAGESPIEGISSQRIAHDSQSTYVEFPKEVVELLKRESFEENTAIVFMGAGDIGSLGDKLNWK